MTMAHPAASAGPSFRVIIAEGKFHGVMAAQTPTGCFMVIRRLFSEFVGIVSLHALSLPQQTTLKKTQRKRFRRLLRPTASALGRHNMSQISLILHHQIEHSAALGGRLGGLNGERPGACRYTCCVRCFHVWGTCTVCWVAGSFTSYHSAPLPSGCGTSILKPFGAL